MSEAVVFCRRPVLENDFPDWDTALDGVEKKTAVVELRLQARIFLEEMLEG